MPQPKVSIAGGVSGNQAEVTEGGLLKVDISGATLNTGDIDVNLTQTDEVTVFQSDAADLKATVTQAGNITIGNPFDGVVSGTVAVSSAPTTAVTGTFWQTTQPVSGTLNVNTVDVSSLATSAKQLAAGHTVDCDDSDVNVTNITNAKITGFARSDQLPVDLSNGYLKISIKEGGFDGAVTGTFWQATQPVSGTLTVNTVDVSTLATHAKQLADDHNVTVSNIATLPTGAAISSKQLANNHDVTVSNPFNGAVTGTFWQATQPVSGTFWQATQPVSGAVTVSGTATVTQAGNVTVVQNSAARTVTGTVDTNELNVLVPAEYNMIHLDYTGDDLTGVRYYTGATDSADPPANSTLVTTLALLYTNNVLDSILRTDA